jgi:SAM-dependent methyltransferase
MKYDPVKNILGNIARDRPVVRRLLYTALGLMFLREWYVKRELRRLLPAAGSTLVYDAGSGFGQYSYFIARNFPDADIYAVDVKEEQIEDCRRFFSRMGIRRCTFAVEDLTAIGHADRFDLILSVDVMEHIPDDVTVFRNFSRALVPGGRVLINTPSDLGGSDTHSPDDESFIEEHARIGYGADEIRSKLESAGLVVESIRYTYGRWGSLAWRLGIKVPMLMLNASKILFLILPFYYALTMPIVLPLMYADYVSTNEQGTGLLVIARKP